MEPSLFDAYMFQQALQHSEFSSCVVITFQVMAVTGVSAGNPYAVRSMSKSGQNKFRAHPGRTWNANNSEIRRILKPADSSQISSTVTTPVTEKRRYFGLPVTHSFISYGFDPFQNRNRAIIFRLSWQESGLLQTLSGSEGESDSVRARPARSASIGPPSGRAMPPSRSRPDSETSATPSPPRCPSRSRRRRR